MTGCRKQIVAFLLVAGAAIGLTNCGITGCIYTEEMLPVPKALAEAKIVVSGEAYLAKGPYAEYGCLPVLGRIEREIVGKHTIDTFGKYLTEGGRTAEPLARGTEFRVTGVAAVTKHGISTIDSGPGPLHVLILKDKAGLTYQIHTVFTGINDSDRFLEYVPAPEKPGEAASPKLLSARNFKEGPHGFSFTAP